MFSGNGKISGRQMFRLLTFDLLGFATLVIPATLAGFCGRDGIFCIAAGILAGLAFLKLMEGSVKQMTGSYPEYLEELLGKFAGRLIQACYVVYLVLLAGYTAYLFSGVVVKSLLREESYWLVLVLILLLAWYGLASGIEGRARIYELLFWLVLIPLFLMLASALDEIDADYWTPVFMSPPKDVLAGSYYVFVCMSIVFLIPFVGGYAKRRESLVRAGRAALLFTGAVCAVLYLILLGIFGSNALAQMEFPAVTLMSTVKITGGFLKRADAFMFGIWFFTLYALLNGSIFYGEMMLGRLLGRPAERFMKKKGGQILILVCVFAVAAVFYRNSPTAGLYEKFLWYAGVPFLVLVALLLAARRLFLRKKGGKRAGLLLLVLFAASGLSGCASAELEERNFPVEMAVRNTGDFTEAWLDVGQSGNRVIDYSHMKVIILEQEFVENAGKMEEFLAFLEEKSDVPRSTYVVVAKDAEKIMELGNGAGESVGTYLEDLFENVSEIKKTAYPTLGMLYQEQENRQETLWIPYVAEEDGKPAVTDYYIWKRGAPDGRAESGTALLSYFTQNELDNYYIKLDQNCTLRLFSSHNRISIEEDGKIAVEIVCSGELMYQQPGEGKSQEELEQLAEAYMNAVAEETLKGEARADVTNSFKKLGGDRREWYGFYEKEPERFEEDMEIEYRADITWVNL